MVEAAFQLEAEHSSVGPHLALDDSSLWMVGKSRIVYFLNFGLLSEKFADRSRVFAVSIHSYSQCLDASKNEIAVQGPRDSPNSVLQILETSLNILIP